MVVTLPFALLLLDVWPLRRVEIGPSRWASAKRLIREKVPLFVLSIASSVLTFLAQREGGTVASTIRLPLSDRIGNALISYLAYIEKMFWPAHLAAYYPYPRELPLTEAAISAFVLLVVTAGAVALARRYPYLLIGWLWYLGTLVPAIGIVQVGTQAMADRYTYLPLIGLFIALVWAIGDLLERWKQARVPAFVAGGAAVLACIAVSRVQVGYWQGSPTLWKHALDVTTDNYAAHTYYGNALASQGKIDDAIGEYREALRIRADYPEAHNNLGPALAGQGKLSEAIAHFREAIRLRPNYADAYSNLGVALASEGKWDLALAEYDTALRYDPDHARARANRQLALRALGRER
jgi:tetratricopeptide (TPR) repeat protein